MVVFVIFMIWHGFGANFGGGFGDFDDLALISVMIFVMILRISSGSLLSGPKSSKSYPKSRNSAQDHQNHKNPAQNQKNH